MKVLMTTDTFYPMVNGVVISTVNLCRELRKLGHEVKILTLSDTGEEKIIDEEIYYLKSFKVRIYPEARIKRPFTGHVIKKLIDWKPDIVHSQTEFSTMLAAKNIAKTVGAPLIHTYHTMYEDYLNYILGGRLISAKTAGRIIKRLLRNVDGVIIPTEKARESLLGFGIKAVTFVIPTGIDLSHYNEKITSAEKSDLLAKYGLKDNNKVLVYVGRVAEEKNIAEIIHFFNEVLKEFSNAKLLIVGGGPYLEDLKAMVKGMSLESSIIFTGMVDPKTVNKYYQLGKAFVTASTSESQGLTYIEALASGLPVICRWDPVIEELIINGENGFTYKDSKEFNNAVAKILKDDIDIKKLSDAARAKADEYSATSFGKKIQDIYFDISQKKSSTS